jgi:hypothetical protein
MADEVKQQHPTEGGSYERQPDGSLKKVAGTEEALASSGSAPADQKKE